MGRKETIVNPTEQQRGCSLPSPKPELRDSQGQMGRKRLKVQCQKTSERNTNDIQHSGVEKQLLRLVHHDHS